MSEKLENQVINFYSKSGKYGEFSNFYHSPIKLEGNTFPTVEHYFQSQKFKGTKHESKIRKAFSPMEAARLGRDRKLPLRKDWESVKIDIMRKGLIAKFSQHKDLKTVLLNTGTSKIVEHTENDNFWGDGGNGSGKNWLGRLLMEVRDSLR